LIPLIQFNAASRAAMPGNSGRSKRLVTKRRIEEKRERLFAESNPHLNRALMRAESWDEAAIEKRGNELFDLARVIWRSPAN